MNRDEFWNHVDAARTRNSEDPESGLREELAGLDVTELASFVTHFDAVGDAAYRWDLWGAAYLIGGGCSDDGFTDFRYGLIAQGRKVYEAALADPDSLADVDDEIPNEGFGYVGISMLEENGGEEEPVDLSRGPIEVAGDEWDFDDSAEMSRRFPRLSARYGS